MSAEVKSGQWAFRVGDEILVFDPRLDFFLCPVHGLFVPARFDDEWTTDSGCPVILGEPHDFCGEHLTPVFLDNLQPTGDHQ